MQINYTDLIIEYHRRQNARTASISHFHRQHELYYLFSGETKYLVGDELFYLKAGDFMFVPKSILHRTDSESCLHNERFLIIFDHSFFDQETLPIFQELNKTKHFHVPEQFSDQIERTLLHLQAEYTGTGKYRNSLIRFQILTLLATICQIKQTASTPPTESELFAEQIMEYIRANYSQDISLPILSKHFCLSETFLSRKFKESSGIGISEYLTSVRIHNAARLLRQGNHSITQVADLCGYNDSNYFSSVFKKLEGITPLKYAKQAALEQTNKCNRIGG